jgi:acetolactate synthase-1/2/3 large subunit
LQSVALGYRGHNRTPTGESAFGFLFSANELETAVRLKSHLVHMIWIDGTCQFWTRNPVKYAEAFGATGFRIDRPDEIASILRKAFDTPDPVLIGVHLDYRQNVKLFEQVYEGSIL